MLNNKNKSKIIHARVRGGLVATLVVALFLYVLLDKPDYKIMSATTNIVVPVAHIIGDGISWPFRAAARGIGHISEHSAALRDNQELRKKLDAALLDANDIAVLRAENERLNQILDVKRAVPGATIYAHTVHNFDALAERAIIIDHGTSAGIGAGDVALSATGTLVGIVTDANDLTARVRCADDAKSSLPVRIAGTGVYGFLRGNGDAQPTLDFFSDPEFIPTPGIRLITSSVGGTLPDGILVGTVSSVRATGANVKLSTPCRAVVDVIVEINK